MDLILWRHADAFEMREVDNDMDRALSPKGERQARRMAEWLNQVLPATTRVLVSPARRCQQTAQALERKFKTVAALGPEGDAESLLAASRWPDAKEPALLIGHQPTLGLAAAYLMSGGALQPWTIRKGAVWWLRSREREALGQVVLVAVRAPEQV